MSDRLDKNPLTPEPEGKLDSTVQAERSGEEDIAETTRLVPRSAEAHHPAPRKYRIERTDLCINCGTCADACVYGCHERNPIDPRKMADPTPDCCRNCFSCVLRCPRYALWMERNPEWEQLGDPKVYTPDIIVSIQDQAAEGKIPVSGAGYGGRFGGEGYDDMWTDMSEIVRPTRDGIHGREHISTTIMLGRKISEFNSLRFDRSGNLITRIHPAREIPIPMILGSPPFTSNPGAILSLALAASKLGTFMTVDASQVADAAAAAEFENSKLMDFFNHLILTLAPDDLEKYEGMLTWASMVELTPGAGQIKAMRRARSINRQLITVLTVPVENGIEDRVVEMVDGGAEVIRLTADVYGQGSDGSVLRTCLEKVHERLIVEGVRDQITLLASGGIAAAEHVPKTIILGADAIVVDVPLLIAMECRVCRSCEEGVVCPSGVGEVDSSWSVSGNGDQPFHRWGATRVINLMIAWRDQLLEVLGAMGIRDVRRLRGERGRAIFESEQRVGFLERLAKAEASEKRAGKGPIHKMPDLPPNPARRRFPVLPGDWKVRVDREKCVDCAVCVDACKYQVFSRPAGKIALAEPNHGKCIGPSCEKQNDWCCIPNCPFDAISIDASKLDTVLGDRRWTAQILTETYRQARTGVMLPDLDVHQTGASEGGFDMLRFVAPKSAKKIDPAQVDLSIPLNKRTGLGPKVEIPMPIYGGGMSYGSISLPVMLGRAMAAEQLDTFISTGEGGYPEPLVPFANHVITQIATGLFGVREETIGRARMVEFKYAQGAKPGLGGHLLGEKNTEEVAAMREAVKGTSLFSPFPFHSVYSVEDHKKHLDWIRSINPDVLLSVKVSTPGDVDMVAVGSFYAGANIVNLDGAYGGTGAAPDIAKKNIAMPIEYAVAQVHDFLVAEGIRDKVVLITGGGIRTPDDVLKAIALGADGVAIGTAELVAIDCVRCGNCERGRGCPIGIATTDPQLASQLTPDWVRDRIVNMYEVWGEHMRHRLAGLGLKSVRELCGRRDLIETLGEEQG
jgi:glutamate synthase domain-containing protein 2/NAD-dependent dihydropyrimidine dehydrogenase PreA subunit